MSSSEEYYEEEGEDYDSESPSLEEDSDEDEDHGLGCAVYDEEFTLRPRKPRYTVLSETDILQRQAEAVKDVATVLSVEASEAAILLRHFKWSASEVKDEWFHNEERVRCAVGLNCSDEGKRGGRGGGASTQERIRDVEEEEEDVSCGICFEWFPLAELRPASCNQHFFCTTCWEGYIATAISDGPGCLNMRCPDPECEASVRESFVLERSKEPLRSKYKKYLLRSYVDDNRNAKWCPAPGCEFAVEFFPDCSSYDVQCKCGHNFCWNCNEEAHRPVDCETVAKWIMKNSAESENMNWILAHSKACPKCKRPIEKNLGCMHMTCTPPCKHEFCWLCLGAWSEHGEKTGGFYACNRYEMARSKGLYDEAERRKEMAQNSLEKYTHYYERWAANEQSRAKAVESLKEMQSTKIETLSEQQSQPISQLKFVTDAWAQIVECRRALKWTYAYGYYLPMEEHAKRQFFEYLQGEADSALENLHTMAEKELQAYVDGDYAEGGQPELPFNEFKSRLAGLTSVTHTYFENLVRALENGLADVEQSVVPRVEQGRGKKDSRSSATGGAHASHGSGASSAHTGGGSTQGLAGSGTRASGAATGLARVMKAAVRGGRSSALGPGSGAAAQAPNVRTPAAPGPSSSRSQNREDGAYWSCQHCTYANRETSSACAMCQLPRGSTRR